MTQRTPFLITVDVEGDDLWSRPQHVTTRNAEYLPRFHELCAAHELRPTYLVTHEMATSPAFREFGREILKQNAAEIAMHLHAWDTPPLIALTADDRQTHPYLFEYAEPLMAAKIHALTALLEDTFGQAVRSHRAGRWGLDTTYAKLLVARGYLADCSVTPHVSWRGIAGDPAGVGGPDYSVFPEDAYFLDCDDIAKAGTSPLLEVPVTIRCQQAKATPRAQWLRPRPGNGDTLLRLAREVLLSKRGHLQLTLHSSELMPAGSPRFRTAEDIERLYEDVEALFALAGPACTPATLSEYRMQMVANSAIGEW